MKKPAILILLMTILAMVFLAGCQDNQEAKKEQTLKDFKVGYLPTPGHVLYFIAQEKGFFQEAGLKVELFQFNNSGEGLNAVKSGKIDAGSFGTAAPLAFIAKGADFTIFGGQQSEGHGLIAKPEKAEGFKDLKNLKGKTIATVRLATGDVVLRGTLLEQGIDWKKDLKVIELDSPAAVLEAVKKGNVDAGVVWTPYIKMAEDQGLQIVKYSGDMLKSHACCRQVALTSKIEENPQDYEKFMTALIKAYAFYQTNQDETVDIISIYVKIDQEIIKAETYGGHIHSIPDPNKAGVQKFWDFMNKAGYISSDLNIDDHINTDIYQHALANLLKQEPNNKIYQELEEHFHQDNK